MTRSKLIKRALFSAFSVLALFAAFVLYLTAKDFAGDLDHGKSLKNSSTSQLARTCMEHKALATFRSDHQSLTQPIYNDKQVIDWLTAALPNVISLDPNAIDQQLLAGERYFTPDGWCSFIDAIADANIIDAVKSRRLAIRMLVHGQPTIKNGLVGKDGVYRWYLEIPVSFTFKSDEAGTTVPHDLTDEVLVVQLERSSSITNPDGIGIAQWVTVRN